MAKHDKIEVGVSTILNPVPVVMVSCAGKDPEKERPNIITVAWAGTVNSEPPMVSVSIRKSRHSYGIIKETGEFVINLVNKSLVKACDHCGIRSGADEDKFKECGLTAVKASGLDYAYAIKEAPVSLSCRVKSITELGSHDMFIAEVTIFSTTRAGSVLIMQSSVPIITESISFLERKWDSSDIQPLQRRYSGKGSGKRAERTILNEVFRT